MSNYIIQFLLILLGVLVKNKEIFCYNGGLKGLYGAIERIIIYWHKDMNSSIILKTLCYLIMISNGFTDEGHIIIRRITLLDTVDIVK